MSHRQKSRHKPRHHTHAVKPASIAPVKAIAKATSVPTPSAPAQTASPAVEQQESVAP